MSILAYNVALFRALVLDSTTHSQRVNRLSFVNVNVPDSFGPVGLRMLYFIRRRITIPQVPISAFLSVSSRTTFCSVTQCLPGRILPGSGRFSSPHRSGWLPYHLSGQPTPANIPRTSPGREITSRLQLVLLLDRPRFPAVLFVKITSYSLLFASRSPLMASFNALGNST